MVADESRPGSRGRDIATPRRGFDKLWYVLNGSVSTPHSTGPGGAFERARLTEGSLLVVRTGRGVLHVEAVGADELERDAADEESQVSSSG